MENKRKVILRTTKRVKRNFFYFILFCIERLPSLYKLGTTFWGQPGGILPQGYPCRDVKSIVQMGNKTTKNYMLLTSHRFLFEICEWRGNLVYGSWICRKAWVSGKTKTEIN